MKKNTEIFCTNYKPLYIYNNKTTKIMNKVFEVKKNGKWSKVQASSIIALNNWADQNKVLNWRMIGMMSIQEMNDSKKLPFVG